MKPVVKTRRRFLSQATALIGAAMVPAAGYAQSPSAPARRIMMVTWRGKTDVERGFEDYLRQRPQSTKAPQLIWRDAAQKRDRLTEIAAEIVRVKPDLVYAWGTPATLGLAGSVNKPHAIIGNTIPLVFALATDPVAAGIARDAQTPGRLITGVSHVAPLATQLDSMRAYRAVKGVGVFFNPAEPNAVSNVARWKEFGKNNNFPIVDVPFPLAGDAPQPLSAEAVAEHMEVMRAKGVNWLYLGPDSFLFTQVGVIATAATQAGLPTFAAVESLIASQAPVLTGLVSKFYQVGQFAAYKAERMLAGEHNVPIETLKRFSLIVRLDTAHTLGVYPPLSMIDYAEFRNKK